MLKTLWGDLKKVDQQDDGTIIVYGIAQGQERDSVGEIITADAMKAALPSYREYPALREMHSASAAGTTLNIEVGEDNITRIEAHVVDERAVKKVLTKVYRGFSIGGKILKRDKDDPSIITGIDLREISLVDRPALPSAKLTMWKADLL